MFLEFLQVFLPLVVYVLLIIILIVGIIIGIKAIKTLDKVDRVVDDVQNKVSSLNSLFSIIDITTDKIVSITDRVVEAASGIIGKIFKKKDKKKIAEKENWKWKNKLKASY